MKIQKLFTYLVMTTMMMSSCVSCQNGDHEELPFEMIEGDYEIRVGMKTPIPIVSGNFQYEVKTDSASSLKAHYRDYPGHGMPFGAIFLESEKKGESKFTVRDVRTNKSITKTVKVVDFYVTIRIKLSKFPTFTNEMRLFLVKNKNKDFYAYHVDEAGKQTKAFSGTYDFNVEDNKTVLSLFYKSDENGTPKESENEPREHKLLFDTSEKDMTYKFVNGLDFNYQDLYEMKQLTLVSFGDAKGNVIADGNISQFYWFDYIPKDVLK